MHRGAAIALRCFFQLSVISQQLSRTISAVGAYCIRPSINMLKKGVCNTPLQRTFYNKQFYITTTMKKKVLLLMAIFAIGFTYAQVGINTDSPQGLFHVDPKGDTSGANNTYDDLIITEAGNVGLGAITPTSRLHIQTDGSAPALRIVDGNEDEDHIFTSDANGYATWKPNDLSSPSVIIWECVHNAYILPAAGQTNLIFVGQSFTFKTYNLTSSVAQGFTSGIHLPAGTYLMFLNGTVDKEFYLLLKIRSSPITESSANNIDMATYYPEHYTSGSAYLSYTKDSRINISIRNIGLDGFQKSGIMSGDTSPHKITFRITLLKIA